MDAEKLPPTGLLTPSAQDIKARVDSSTAVGIAAKALGLMGHVLIVLSPEEYARRHRVAMAALSIAEGTHELNRAVCEFQGDRSQVAWAQAPSWQKESAIHGVVGILDGTIRTAEDSHRSWLAEKERTGWRYGEVEDAEAKTHPCFLPYAQLPESQRIKDTIFRATVLQMARALKVTVAA